KRRRRHTWLPSASGMEQHVYRSYIRKEVSSKLRDSRMRFDEARRILARHCQEIDGGPPSTNKRPYSRPRSEGARREEWWLSAPRQPNDGDTPRVRAYLGAYCEIQNSNRFPATGIPLDGHRFLYPDKGVMKAALLLNLATFDHASGEFIVAA